MCAYIVLKFNDKYSLLFFSYFMCAYIIVLKFHNKYSLIIYVFVFYWIPFIKKIQIFTCDCSDHPPLMGPLNPYN